VIGIPTHFPLLGLTYIEYPKFRSTDLELLQRYRRDRRELLNFLLAASVIKKVVMPPGAVSYDDIDLDQISVDYILECARKSKRHCEFCCTSIKLDGSQDFIHELLSPSLALILMRSSA